MVPPKKAHGSAFGDQTMKSMDQKVQNRFMPEPWVRNGSPLTVVEGAREAGASHTPGMRKPGIDDPLEKEK